MFHLHLGDQNIGLPPFGPNEAAWLSSSTIDYWRRTPQATIKKSTAFVRLPRRIEILQSISVYRKGEVYTACGAFAAGGIQHKNG